VLVLVSFVLYEPLSTIVMLIIKEEIFSIKLNAFTQSQYHPMKTQTIFVAFRADFWFNTLNTVLSTVTGVHSLTMNYPIKPFSLLDASSANVKVWQPEYPLLKLYIATTKGSTAGMMHWTISRLFYWQTKSAIIQLSKLTMVKMVSHRDMLVLLAPLYAFLCKECSGKVANPT